MAVEETIKDRQEHWLNRLKNIRNTMGLSQRQLAAEWRVSHGAVSQWEAGKRIIPGPITLLIEIYEENLGVKPIMINQRTTSSWTSRTLRSTLTASNIAVRLAASNFRQIVASSEKASTIKDGTMEAIGEKLLNEMGELKGPVMKIGQMISYIDYGLPDKFQARLMKLQDSVPPMTTSEVEQVFIGEFNKRPQSMFKVWHEQPFAAASIGQVHYGETFDGRKVAVKVQYPDIMRNISTDLRNMGLINQMADGLMRYNKINIAEEWEKRLKEETDYFIEAKNIREFKGYFGTDTNLIIPNILTDYSSTRIITTDFVEGQSIHKWLETANQKEKNRIGETLFRMSLQCIFNHGVFNADPHPGNFMIKDGKLVMLDFGFVIRHSEKWIKSERSAIKDAMNKKYDKIIKKAIETGSIPRPDKIDLDHFVECFVIPNLRLWQEDRCIRVTKQHVKDSMAALRSFKHPFRLAVPKEDMFKDRFWFGTMSLLALIEPEINFRKIAKSVLD